MRAPKIPLIPDTDTHLTNKQSVVLLKSKQRDSRGKKVCMCYSAIL